MIGLSGALLAAMLSDRAFLIRWRLPEPLTEYLVPTIFNWDAEDIEPLLPPALLRAAIYLPTEEGCEDLLTLHHTHAVVVHNPHQICAMCTLLFTPASANGPPPGAALELLPLLLPCPARFYHLVGQVLSSIMQPSERLLTHVQEKWWMLPSCRHVVALQIRRGACTNLPPICV